MDRGFRVPTEYQVLKDSDRICASQGSLAGALNAQKVVFGLLGSMASPDHDSTQSTSVRWSTVLVKLKR